jgi:hypothetical protein
MSRTALVFAWCLLALGCGSPEDSTRRQFRERLDAPTSLTSAEIDQLIGYTLAAIGGRPVRIREQGAVRELDAKGRAEVLAVLGRGAPVGDAGLRAVDSRKLRGIEGPGTPVHSEIDAAQTLWIDVDTFLPHRFELTYSLPGFGDYAYDLVW